MPKKKIVSIDGTKYEVKEAFEAKYRCRICSQHNHPTPCIARFNYPDKENDVADHHYGRVWNAHFRIVFRKQVNQNVLHVQR